MRKLALVVASSALVISMSPAPVAAKGCVRGAIAGGVAGHYARHHAVVGAVGGCIAARAYYKHKANQAAKANVAPVKPH